MFDGLCCSSHIRDKELVKYEHRAAGKRGASDRNGS